MRDIRISIFTIVSILVLLGVVMIYSSSGIYALQELGDSFYFLKRHLMFLLVGLMGMGVMMTIDYRDLRRLAKPGLLVCLALLALVLVPGIGRMVNGARRWFAIGPFFFQPSEITKLAVLVYTADFLARKHAVIESLREGFLPPMFVLGAVSVLILKQPDLGSTVLIGSVVMIMLLVAGVRWRYLGTLALMALPAFYFLIYRVPYRWRRIMTFLNPWEDSLGAGFQLTQSQIALGVGGFFGREGPLSLGKSMQKLFYLPAAHTDFIFSIIGEEMGCCGTLGVILLFAAFIWYGARVAKRTTDPFGYFLSTGIVAMIGLQAVVNIGVSIGALPTKGLPLPFVSYGGSALVFNLMAVGLLLNISRTQDLESMS